VIRDQDGTAAGQRQGGRPPEEARPAADSAAHCGAHRDDVERHAGSPAHGSPDAEPPSRSDSTSPSGSGSTRSDVTRSGSAGSDAARSGSTRSDSARSDSVRSDSARSGSVRSGSTRSDATGSGRQSAEPSRGASRRASSGTDRIEGDEPLLSARVHRPSDLMRMALGLLGIIVVLIIATFAHGTTAGLEEDIHKGTAQAPPLLISVTGLASSIAVLLVPVAFAVERLIKRDGLRIADGVLAAVLAHGASLAVDLWVAEAAPDSVRDALTKQISNQDMTAPVHSYLAPVIAYMTAVGMARRPRWRVLLWAVLLLNAFAILIPGYSTPFSILVTLLIGWSVAYGTLYTVGTPNVRPTGHTLLAGLRHVGFKPVSAVRVEEPESARSERTEAGDHGRRYRVTLEDDPPIDVTVVDREQQAQGFFYQTWRRITLRGITQGRSFQSLRQTLEQEALLAYATTAAGANAPRLIATSELGPDAVMLVYEHIDARSLDALPDEEITNELMSKAWHEIKTLQSRRIAHRRLIGSALLADRSGTVYVADLRRGEIAAGEVVLRMDVAQLMTTFGLRVGAERAVAAAVAVLGPDQVADSLPLLQPIALSRSTRTTLRRLAKERAQREREAVIEASRANKEAKETRDAGAEDEGAAEGQEEAQGDGEGTGRTRSEGRTGVTAAAEGHPRHGAHVHARTGRRTGRTSSRALKQAEKRAIDEALEEAREEDLLAQIRQQVLLIRPQAPVEPARLERIKPRTLVSFIAGALAAYFLLTQLSQVEFSQVIGEANWAWVGGVALFAALTHVAAAMALLGFVPEKVPLLRTVAAQVAGSFVKLVAPAAVGGVALNTRFLQRSGVRPGHAVASVGASQLFGLGGHITLLLIFGYLTGTEHTPTLSPSRTVIAGLLTAAVLVLIVTAIPALRRWVSDRLRSLFAGVVPRMLDVVQRPRKLATGIGGMLLLTLLNVMCLDACVRAFGGQISYASIAVVFLAGNALGSAAPTPGGLGAIEAALIAGLITFGVPKEIATPAVLLFRLMTLWLPVLPGWVCFTQLTRKGSL
jgi:uncharacterized protein (TIRG00374 family)